MAATKDITFVIPRKVRAAGMWQFLKLLLMRFPMQHFKSWRDGNAAMLEEGIPLGVVYFIKKARDGLSASPQYYRTDDTPEKRTARQKEYIKTVRELQTVLSDVRTVEDAVRAYDRFFVDNGYLEKVQGWGSGIHYRATKKGQDNPVITNKLSNTMPQYWHRRSRNGTNRHGRTAAWKRPRQFSMRTR